MSNDPLPTEVRHVTSESKAIEAAIRSAVRDTLIEHKQLGLPVVIGRDGRAVWIPADEIEIDVPTGGCNGDAE